MAKLDRPLYGDYATGTFARVLSFRHTPNPPDAPGDPAVYLGTVCKIPVMTCGPSSPQLAQRLLYASAVAAWRALSDDERSTWGSDAPAGLSGFNFFIRLYLFPAYAYFNYCVFGLVYFQLSPGPDQPAAADYDSPFPSSIDEFPTMRPGSDSVQAWLLNRAFSAVQSIQQYLIDHHDTIEA